MTEAVSPELAAPQLNPDFIWSTYPLREISVQGAAVLFDADQAAAQEILVSLANRGVLEQIAETRFRRTDNSSPSIPADAAQKEPLVRFFNWYARATDHADNLLFPDNGVRNFPLPHTNFSIPLYNSN